MTHLELTRNEKLLIYMAFNGTCINRFYAEDPDRMIMITEAELMAYGTAHEIAQRIINYIEYNSNSVEYLSVDLSILLEKLSKLNLKEIRQLRNEIYAYWNSREIHELIAYCNLLIKNIRDVSNMKYNDESILSKIYKLNK